jgi:5'(3')-deoxyribonucleotidase
MVMKKILYIDMDNVLVDFKSALPKISKDKLTFYEGRLDEVDGIFSKMEPISGAIDAFIQLSELFDTYILSTSPWENPSAWSDKLNWVKRHLGQHAYKRLILTHHKNLNNGHFLVDDRLKNGADKFQGEHIHFGTEKFPSWRSVIDYLISKAGD